MWKKLVLFLGFFIWGVSAKGQIFTQTFIDRCTGETKIVTANFTNGPTPVAFYNRVRVFTPQEAVNGILQQWLQETYAWWNALSPCSTTTTQTQQAQQTAQQAQQAAQTAASAASTIVVPTTPPPVTPPPTTPPPASGTTTSPPPSSGSTSTGGSSSSSSSSSGGSSSSEGSSNSGGSTSETKSEETKTETKTEEPKKEETKTEEKKEETKSEEKKEESKEESKEEEKSEEESKEEEKSEEEKKEKEEKKKQRALLPIQLKADLMAMQNPLGGYNAAMSFSASQSSIFGDVSYGANLMVFDNLKQATLGLNKSKIYMDDTYTINWIESIGLNYGNNFGTQSIGGNFMRLKPMGKYGVAGFGVNYTYMFGGLVSKPMASMGYNLLYTNSFVKDEGRLTYAPAFIVSQTPISFTLDKNSNVSKDAMFILSNSFTYSITKKFTVNFGYTAIKSTNPLIPLISSFMIGSKLPF